MHPQPVVSVAPVTLPAPERGADLQVRVSAPRAGQDLPIVLFAHGFGSSLQGYHPLTDHWAAHGFVVVAPTFLDSRTLSTGSDDPRRPDWWRHRVADMVRVLDELEVVIDAVPGLGGRADRERVAAAGHSFGGQTAAVLLGLRVGAPDGTPGPDLSDARIRAGVLVATAGDGGDALASGVAGQFPWLAHPDFGRLTTPALVFSGDADHNPLTTRGPAWTSEPYRRAPGARHLVTLFGGDHFLGGISGYDARETVEENPRHVGAVAGLSAAFLRSALVPDDPAWDRARARFATRDTDLGRVESK